MKISIITPVCDDVSAIDTCIKSVVSQTYPHIEYIIVDYGSSFVNKNRIQRELVNGLFYDEPGVVTLGDAITFGIRKSRGDVVCVLSPWDELFEKGTIQKVVNTFKENETNIVYGKGVMADGSDILKTLRTYGSKPYDHEELPFGKIPLHTSIYMERQLLMDLGFSDKNYSVKSDYELYLRLFMLQSVFPKFLDEFVVKISMKEKLNIEPVYAKKVKSNENSISFKPVKINKVAMS